MHVSLDSALGRQRRLNQIGETITSIAAPTAAYSLRSLTGGDPKVVRVRRDSDNTERNFTVSEINSGAMLSFVNTQTVKPLDVRALESDGDRDGDFQIASAAYSLRSLGNRQATVTSSGDTAGDTSGKYVVQVRRSSDNTIKSFTADEVTDGTLLTFVNTPTNGVFSNSGYETFDNASASGFTATNDPSTGDGFATSDILDGVSGDQVTVTFDINITSGSPKLSLRSTLVTGAVRSDIFEYTSSGSKTATLTANGNYVGIGFTEGDSPSSFTVSNFKIIASGFVRTWYDQSVTGQDATTGTPNARHVVQTDTSKQPTIVTNGSLVTSNSLPAVDFTDSYTLLERDEFLTGQLGAYFSITESDVGSTSEVFFRQGTDYKIANEFSGSTGNVVSFLVDNEGGSTTSANVTVSADLGDGTTRLISTLLTARGANGHTVFVDGGNETSVDTSSIQNTDFSAADAGNFAIGGIPGSSNSDSHGKGSEFIFYNNDQTANRGAIEGNIGDHYGITGVPTEDNNVNGFVTKWYDQSGNNRPLIQTTATEQPFIVESGSFLNGVKSNKASSNDTMQNLQVSTDGTTANFGTDDWASGASSKLGLIYVGSVPASLIFKTDSDAVIWGGGRGVSGYQSGGLSLQIIKGGNDSWKLMNERQGLSPSRIQEALQTSAQNTDGDVIWYGIADNRDFTVSVNGAVETDTESADLDVRENAALSLFGAYGGDGTLYYQRSGGGVCKECYLYAGTSITDIPTIATKINEHYSIYT